MEKLNYTWDQQFKDTETICSQIEKDEFQPNVIVGISRGGLIPGVMMSHKLNVPFKPVHASTRDFPHWENYLPRPTDKKILIVDDICDSGETFAKYYNYHQTEFSFPFKLRTACLHYKPQTSSFQPTLWANQWSSNDWIIYPWERKDSESIQDYKV